MSATISSVVFGKMKHKNLLFFALTILGIFMTSVTLAYSVPEEVTNVQFTVDEGKARISWDAADDADGIVIGYKIYYGTTSVQNIGDQYDDEITVPGNLTTTILEALEPGVQYFLGITAIDDEENQSENYSPEISVLIPVGNTTPDIPEEPVIDEPTEPDLPISQNQERIFQLELRVPKNTYYIGDSLSLEENTGYYFMYKGKK